MGRSFSSDLRERIARDISTGHSCRATARKFAVSVSTAIRLGIKVRAGEDLSARKRGRKEGTGKLAPFVAFLVEHVVLLRHKRLDFLDHWSGAAWTSLEVAAEFDDQEPFDGND